MVRRLETGLMAVLAFAVSASLAGADVKVQEKTHFKFEGMLGAAVNVLGGKAAKEGITSTVAVKGDRRSRISDIGGEIVDLAEEKVYELDVKHKTYKVTTFAELRRQMQEEEARAAKSAAAEARDEETSKPSSSEPQKELDVDFNVKETGETRTVNGFDARRVLLTVALREKGKTLEQSGGLVLTSDSWVASSAKISRDLAAFDERYFEKLHGPATMAAARSQMATLLATYPQLRQGMSRLQAETAKMDGTAVLTTMTIEVVKSPEQMAQASASSDEPAAKLGGLLGKFGKKKGDDAAKDGAARPKNRSVLLTTTHEILGIAPEVTSGDVALPAGYTPKS